MHEARILASMLVKAAPTLSDSRAWEPDLPLVSLGGANEVLQGAWMSSRYR